MDGQKNYQRLFYRKLQSTVKHKLVALLAISTALFYLGQYTITWYDNAANANAQLEVLSQSITYLDTTTRQGLNVSETLDNVVTILSGNIDRSALQAFDTDMWQLEERLGLDTQFLITTTTGQVVYSSFVSSDLTTSLLSYNRSICYNAQKSQEVYRTIYADGSGYADTLYVKPVLDGDTVVGFFSIYLSGSDWNFYLAENNYDGVITDAHNNALYTSKPSLLNNHHQFYSPESYVWVMDDSRYWVASAVDEDLDVNLYALVYYPPNQGFVFGFFILAAMAVVWYGMAKRMNRSMAQYNAASIEQLVGEIRQVAKGDYSHKIHMDTEDEFEEVAHQISIMLDNLMELNAKNTELIQMNCRIEISQLTAQMNPHFLYNTLEMIRNLVMFDARRSEEILIALTKILRYSVNNSTQDVIFGDDLAYIYGYLDIQSCRFGKRFVWDMDIDDDCKRCYIPKLLLQPLIENSIKYGFEKKMDIHVHIRARMNGGSLLIEVTDDGLGMEEAQAQILRDSLSAKGLTSTSIGLRNLARRLWLRYGEDGDLTIDNRTGDGFAVLVRLPVQTQPPNIERSDTPCTKC